VSRAGAALIQIKAKSWPTLTVWNEPQAFFHSHAGKQSMCWRKWSRESATIIFLPGCSTRHLPPGDGDVRSIEEALMPAIDP
jgi:hypothetical protein